jgi:FMN phosphatase YigB (HAD superfamily)
MEKAIIFDWVGTLYKFGKKGLFDYSEKVLTEMQKDYRIAVISRASHEDLKMRMRQISKLSNCLDLVIVDTYKSQKQFRECIESLHTNPKNTLIVGDRAYSEIRIGNKMGCKTAWIQNGKYAHELPNKKSGKPTYIIDSVENLLKVLQNGKRTFRT